MTEERKVKYHQQGDVLLFPISEIPEGAKRVNHNHLAEGEVTGHYHAAVAEPGTETKVNLVERDGVLYLQALGGPATITHQEHGHITVPEGTYRVGIVREYNHFDEEARAVAD